MMQNCRWRIVYTVLLNDQCQLMPCSTLASTPSLQVASTTATTSCGVTGEAVMWSGDYRLSTTITGIWSPSAPGFALLTTTIWSCHVLGLCVMVHTVFMSLHCRLGTCCLLIWRMETLVKNSSYHALRPGSLCKRTHRRHLHLENLFKWHFSNTQILDVIDLLIM